MCDLLWSDPDDRGNSGHMTCLCVRVSLVCLNCAGIGFCCEKNY